MDTTSQKLNTSPLVSILMPAYNREDFIGAAIESVCAQTYSNWELIIIDDASKDATPVIVHSYQDPRIRYIRQETNQGIVKTRNRALTEVQGAYVAVLDSDDVWLDPRKLEAQVTFLEKESEHVVVGTFTCQIDATGTETGRTTYNVDDGRIRASILTRNQFTHSSVLMRKSALDKTVGYRNGLDEDFDLFLQLGTFGKFANIPEYMTGYRIHGTNISRYKLGMVEALTPIIKRHAHAYPHAFLALLKNQIRLLLAHLGV